MKRWFKPQPSMLLASLLLGGLASQAFGGGIAANALPTGGQVTAGQAQISQSGQTLTVGQSSQRAVVTWNSFDVGSQSTVNFNQPNAQAATLNVVNSASKSMINGAVNANGQVIFVNNNGVVFGSSAVVNVGGMVATTMNVDQQSFMNGDATQTYTGGSTGKVVNKGKITGNNLNSYIALMAPQVVNQGVITATMSGNNAVALVSGQKVTLTFSNSQLINVLVDASVINSLISNKLLIQVGNGQVIMAANSASELVGSTIKNTGTIAANGITSNGGKIRLSAGNITQSGTIEANSTQGSGGSIEITGGDVTLESGSKTTAIGGAGGGVIAVGTKLANPGVGTLARTVTVDSGALVDASAVQSGQGGSIKIWSDTATHVAGTLKATGGVINGSGGQIETSSRGQVTYGANLLVDTRAPQGNVGRWVTDPINITVDSSAASVISTALMTTNVILDATGSSSAYGTVTSSATPTISFLAGANVYSTNPSTGLTLVATGGNIDINSQVTAGSITALANIINLNQGGGLGTVGGAGGNIYLAGAILNILGSINSSGSSSNNSNSANGINALSRRNSNAGSALNSDNNIYVNSVNGNGNNIVLLATGDIQIGVNAVITSNGFNGGSITIASQNGNVTVGGIVDAVGKYNQGGHIYIVGAQSTILSGALISVDGLSQAGLIQIGVINNIGGSAWTLAPPAIGSPINQLFNINTVSNAATSFNVLSQATSLDSSTGISASSPSSNSQVVANYSNGGQVIVAGNLSLDSSATIVANGDNGGLVIMSSPSGTYQNTGYVQTNGGAGLGGTIAVSGLISTTLTGAIFEANGQNGGGNILVGRDFVANPMSGDVFLTSSLPSLANIISLPTSASTSIDTNSSLSANAIFAGNGGNVLLYGDNFSLAGNISAQAFGTSGNGGFVETSAQILNVADSAIITTISSMGQVGSWVLDPYDFYVASSGGNITGTAISTALSGGNVTITTSSGTCNGVTCTNFNTGTLGNIYIYDAISYSSHTLTLNSSNNIYVGSSTQTGLITVTGAGGLVLNTGSVVSPSHAGDVYQGVLLMGMANSPTGGLTSGYLSSSTFITGTAIGFNGQINLNTSGSVSINSNTYTVINSEAQLVGVVSSGNYVIGSNISLANIYSGALIASFNGNLNGFGHLISGLNISSTSGNTGLIGTVYGSALISNFGVSGSINTTSTSPAGGIAGYAYPTNLPTNLYASVNITGGAGKTGGMFGVADGVVNSYATGNITTASNNPSASQQGGLIGSLDYSVYASNLVSNAYATGSLTYNSTSTSGSYYGGLIGLVNVVSTISNSYATGSITVSNGRVQGIGGLLGTATQTTTITGCFSSGGIDTSSYSSNPSSSVIGGLVGGYNIGAIIINNSYSISQIKLYSGELEVGGLVGNFGTNSSSIESSYFGGTITCVHCTSGVVGGALFGSMPTAGTYQDNYWNSTLNPGYDLTYGGVSGANSGNFSTRFSNNGATSITSSQMQYASNFSSGFGNTSGSFTTASGWGYASGVNNGFPVICAITTCTSQGSSLLTDTFNNNSGDNNWATANNWSLGYAPTSSVGSAIINNFTVYYDPSTAGSSQSSNLSLFGSLVLKGSSNVTFSGSIADYVSGTSVGSIFLGNTGNSYSGIVTLSGANTYTGGTTINGGTLSVSSGGSSSSNLSSGSVTISGGTLLVNATATISNAITLGSGTNKIAAASTKTATMSGVIGGGSNTLTVGDGTNNGTVVLSNANTFTGGTTISGGTLSVSSGGSSGSNLSSGSVTISGGTLLVNTTATIGNAITLGSGTDEIAAASTQTATMSGVIGGGSNSLMVGDGTNTGTVVLSNANTYSGNTTISAGTLKVGNATALGTSAVTVSSGAALDLNGTVMTGTNALTLNGTGISNGGALMNSSSSAGTYAGLVTLGSASLIVGGTGSIALSNTGTITGSGLGLTLGGAAGGSIASIIGTAAGTLTKQDAGTWTLTGANTYSGNTAISAGTLKVGNATALGTSAVTVSSGAALDLNGTVMTGMNALTLNGTGISNGGALMNSSSSAGTYAGLVTLGSASLILGGTGSISLSNTGTITGSGKALTLGGAAGGSIASIIGTAAGTLTKQDAGTWTLTGANTYSGNTAISAGTLKVGNATALGTSAVTVSSGAALDLNGTVMTGTNALTLNGTGISNGGALMNSSSSAGTYAGLVTLGSASLIEGGTGSIALSNTGTITGSGKALTLGGAAGGSIASIIGTAAGTLTKQDAGTWTLTGADTYSGNTTISAGTLKVGNATALGTSAVTVSSGAALDLNGTVMTGTNALTLNGTGISNGGALMNSSSSAGTYAGLVTLGTASLIVGGTGSIALSNTGTITGSGLGLTLGGAAGGSIASIIGTAAGTLTKQDAGTWTLTGADTFTGGTTINGGTLSVSSGGSSGSNLSSGSVTISGGTLLVNTTATIGNAITLGSGTDEIAAASTKTATMSGVIGGGSNSLTVGDGTNTGTVVLSNTNTYSGNTTISAGTLQISGSGSLGSGSYSGNISNNGSLKYSSSVAQTLSGIISGAGSITKDTSSTSTLTLSDANTYTGNTTISAGTLQISGSGSLGSGSYSGNISNNGSLQYSSSVAQTLSGIISGVGSITKDTSSTSTLTLSDANTYSGNTTISAGTLKVGNATALGTSAVTVSSGAALDLNGTVMTGTNALTLNGTGISSGGALMNSSSSAGTYAGLVTLGSASLIVGGTGSIALSNTGTITGSGLGLTLGGAAGGSIASIIGTAAGTLTKQDAGTWTLTGADTYSGNTTISAGTLALNNIGALGSGSVTIGTSGTLDLKATGTFTLASLTMAGNGAITNSSGSSSSITNLSVTGNSTLAGTITTYGNQTYSGAVTLAGNLLLTTATSGGTNSNSNISFSSTVDSASNGYFGLSVANGTGTTAFDGLVGANSLTSALGYLCINSTGCSGSATGTMTGGGTTSLSGNLTTSGNQTYGGDLALSANTVLTSTANNGNGNISISGNVNAESLSNITGTLELLGGGAYKVSTDNGQTWSTYTATASDSGGSSLNITYSGISSGTASTNSSAGVAGVSSYSLNTNSTSAYTYLIVAGGGGGAHYGGGGGGGGGILSGTVNFSSGSQTITVGSGGIGYDSTYSIQSQNGGSSGISGTGISLTAIGGGAGGSGGFNGFTGGAGGGGGSVGSSYGQGGVGTSGQGSNGGAAGTNGSSGSSGAGVAGGGGGVGNTGQGGAGGTGAIYTIPGTTSTSTFGGGGAGGSYNYVAVSGGAGGGGSLISCSPSSCISPSLASQQSGTANTGGGGAGVWYGSPGSGGSGIVILSGILSVHQNYYSLSINSGSVTFGSSIGSSAAPLTSLSITSSGTVTANSSIYTSSLLVKNSPNATFNNVGNSIGTLAASGVGNLKVINGSALTIGTVLTVNGISASGLIDVETTGSNNLTVSQSIASTQTTGTSLILNAGETIAAGVTTGGDIIGSGSPTISLATNATAQLYTGSIAGSTILSSWAASGSGQFRYDSNATTQNYTTAIGTGVNVIYREAPTITAVINNVNMEYGATSLPSFTVTSISGTKNGDVVAASSIITSGLTSTATVYSAGVSVTGNAGATYSITGTSNTQPLGYLVSFTPGTLTMTTKSLTYTTAAATGTYGTLSTLGNVTLVGLIGNDTANATVSLYSGGTLTALSAYTNAGTYSQKVTSLSNSNYSIASSGNTLGNLVISPKTLTYSVADSSGTYGTTASTGTVTLTGVVNNDSVNSTITVLDSSSNPVTLSVTTNAGTYSQKVTSLSNSNYSIASSGNTIGNLVISPKTLTYSVADSSGTYGTTASTGSVTLTGVVNNDSVNSTITVLDGSSNPVTLSVTTNAGTYSQKVTSLSNSNYSIASSGNTLGNLVISPKTLTYSVADSLGTYGTTASTGSVTLTGVVNNDSVNSTITVLDGSSNPVTLSVTTNAGTYSQKVTSLSNSNYSIASSGNTLGNLVISPKTLTYSVADSSGTYGTTASTGSVTLTGVVNNDSVNSTITVLDGSSNPVTLSVTTNAGTYSQKVTSLSNSNYSIASSGNTLGNLVISPKTLTYSVADSSGTYGTTASTGSVTLTGVVNNDSVNSTITVLDGSSNPVTLSVTTNAGTYSQKVTSLSNSNYSIASSGNTIGNLVISPKTLTYSVADSSGTYGTTASTGSVTLTGVVNNDSVNSTITVLDGSSNPVTLSVTTNAGTYSQKVTSLSNSNYSIASSGNTLGNLVISPKALTYSVADSSGTYGTTASTGSVTLTGVVNNDSVNSTITVLDGSSNPVTLSVTTNAGTYSQKVTSLSNSNYSIASSGNTIGNLVISPKTLTYSVADSSGTYGTTASTGSVTLTGVVNNDSVNSTITVLDSSSNPVTLSVTTNAGTYSQTVTALSNSNYSIASSGNTPGVLTIGKANLVATGTQVYNGTTTFYGAHLTITGVNGQTFTASGSADLSTKNVQTNQALADISGLTLSGSASLLNYNSLSASQTSVSVTPYAVTLTPSSVTKVYDGTSISVLNASGLTGLTSQLLGSDTVSSGTVTFQGNANVGTGKVVSLSAYTINDGNGGANYSVITATSNSGVITPASLTITAANDAKFVTQTDIQGSANNCGSGVACSGGYAGLIFNGFVGGETSSVLSGSPSITRTNSSVNSAGTYTGVLVPSGYTSTNYSITYQSGSYTIVPADTLLVKVIGAASSSSVQTTYGTAPTYTNVTAQYLNGSNVIVSLTPTITGSIVTVNDGSGGAANFTLSPSGATQSTAGMVSAGSYNLTAASTTITGSNFNSLTVVGSLTVNPLSISASNLGITGVTKVYDGNSNISALTLNTNPLISQILSGDVVSILGTGSFADANVGTNKSATISLALTGTDAGNYSLSSNSLTSNIGTITQLASVTYTGSSGGTWSTASNWAGGAIPTGNNVATVIIPAGKTVVYDSANVGIIGSTITDNGVISFTNNASYTLSNTVSGSGSISQSGAGALTLSGRNSFSGGVNINSASLIAANTNALGSGALTSNGGSLSVASGITLPSLTVNGAITLASDINTTGAQMYNGAVTLGSGTALAPMTLSTSNAAITFNSNLNSDVNNRSLTINAGTGVVTFAGKVGSMTAGDPYSSGLGINITNLSVTAGSILLENDISTLGTQTYTGTLMVSDNGSDGHVRILLSEDPSIVVNGTIDDIEAGTHTLNIEAISTTSLVAPTIALNGDIGSTAALASINVVTGIQDNSSNAVITGVLTNPAQYSGTLSLAGNITTTGAQSYTSNTIELGSGAANQTQQFTSTNNGDVTFNKGSGVGSGVVASASGYLAKLNAGTGSVSTSPLSGINYQVISPVVTSPTNSSSTTAVVNHNTLSYTNFLSNELNADLKPLILAADQVSYSQAVQVPAIVEDNSGNNVEISITLCTDDSELKECQNYK